MALEPMRDCRVANSNCPPYMVKIDREWTLQNRKFNRGDMSFFGFTLSDVHGKLDEVAEQDVLDSLREEKK